MLHKHKKRISLLTDDCPLCPQGLVVAVGAMAIFVGSVLNALKIKATSWGKPCAGYYSADKLALLKHIICVVA
ncbi:hypothetical protein DTV46_08385 [Salmonella enterica subsp. salamae]|nr:hypothetical protein [Salmonella enterica subsp. salamae]